MLEAMKTSSNCVGGSGQAIAHQPARRGFGSEFLEKSIPHMLNGRFERRFDSDRIDCTVSFLLDKNDKSVEIHTTVLILAPTLYWIFKRLQQAERLSH
jgi:hypothetical protein